MCRLNTVKQDMGPAGCQHSPTNWPAKNQQQHALQLWSGGWIKIKTHTSVLFRFVRLKTHIQSCWDPLKLQVNACWLLAVNSPAPLSKQELGLSGCSLLLPGGEAGEEPAEGPCETTVLEPDNLGPILSSLFSLGPLVTYRSQTTIFLFTCKVEEVIWTS